MKLRNRLSVSDDPKNGHGNGADTTQPAPAQDVRPEEVVVRASPRAGLGTFASLAYRDFRYLWIGTFFSSGGQWIQQVTLSWMVYDMTKSPLMLGAVNGVRAIPFLLVSPFGGVAADRMDRRKLMLVTQTVLAVTSFLMGLLVHTGAVQVWHVFVFTFLTGVAWSFNQPVRQALVPSLVPPEALMNAISLTSVAFNASQIIGPSVGGLLIGMAGVDGNFFIQGVAYAGVVVTIYLMHVPPGTTTAARSSSILSNLAEGVRYVWHHEVIRTVMFMALVPIVFAMPYATLMPVFAQEVLGVGPEGLGLLMAAPGAGAVVGTLILASLGNFQRKGPLLLGATMALGVSLILFGFSSWLPLSLLFLAGVGGTQIAYMATTNTVLQTLVPNELRGRVMSLYMLSWGMVPLGSLMAGGMASVGGAPLTTVIMGALVLLMGIAALLWLPIISKLE